MPEPIHNEACARYDLFWRNSLHDHCTALVSGRYNDERNTTRCNTPARVLTMCGFAINGAHSLNSARNVTC